jgi:hypothetical protein
MIFIFGERTRRIAQYIDHEHICYHCNSFDREVNVYRSYVHFCLIPVFPVRKKFYEMHCRKCGDQTNLESVINSNENSARTPIYLYSAPLIFLCIAAFWFYWNKYNESKKADLVSNPLVGDIYTIRSNETAETKYYFLRIIAISRDSVLVYHNNLDYGDFVTHLEDDDFFVRNDTVAYSKKSLHRMLQNNEIYIVDRNYGTGEGFNRIK